MGGRESQSKQRTLQTQAQLWFQDPDSGASGPFLALAVGGAEEEAPKPRPGVAQREVTHPAVLHPAESLGLCKDPGTSLG